MEDKESADYEKVYAYLQDKTLPKYQTLDLALDYYPEDRKVDYRAVIGLSAGMEDTLFLSFKDDVRIKSIQLNRQKMRAVHTDSLLYVYGYLPHEAVKSDSIFSLEIEAGKQYTGLSQSDLQTDITANGSYASVKEFFADPRL